MKELKCPVCSTKTLEYSRHHLEQENCRSVYCNNCYGGFDFHQFDYRFIKSLLFPKPDRTEELEKEISGHKKSLKKSGDYIRRLEKEIERLKKALKNYIELSATHAEEIESLSESITALNDEKFKFEKENAELKAEKKYTTEQ